MSVCMRVCVWGGVYRVSPNSFIPFQIMFILWNRVSCAWPIFDFSKKNEKQICSLPLWGERGTTACCEPLMERIRIIISVKKLGMVAVKPLPLLLHLATAIMQLHHRKNQLENNRGG